MADRPAPPTTPPAYTPSDRPADRATERPDGTSEDTAIRPGLAERIQAKLGSNGRGGSDDAERGEDAVAAPSAPTGRKGRETGRGSSTTSPVPGSSTSSSRSRSPRRARLRLTRIDPWSVMKTSFLLAIAFGIVTVVAVFMIMQVVEAVGVFDRINETITDVLDDPSTAGFDITDYVGTDRVVGFAMLVAAVDVVLITAIATLGAFLYNMSAALLGGIEVTLAEDN